MGRSQESFGKKEKEKKRQRKRQDKEQKREERKANATSGNLEDMLAYVDEFGNISATPPDPTKKKKEVNLEDIEISVPKQEVIEGEAIRNGTVNFFNDQKGYGFIIDLTSQQSIFVHANNLIDQIKERDKVTFEVEMGPKGPMAVNVKKI